jgi:hypothetical protein
MECQQVKVVCFQVDSGDGGGIWGHSWYPWVAPAGRSRAQSLKEIEDTWSATVARLRDNEDGDPLSEWAAELRQRGYTEFEAGFVVP